MRRLQRKPRKRASRSAGATGEGDGRRPAPARLTIATNVSPKPQRVLFDTQEGFQVPAFVIRPAEDSGLLVAVDDRGKEAMASDPLVVEAVRKRGWQLWAIDPRGIGELEIPKSGWAFAVSLLVGENFVWRQGWDIRRIIELASTATPTHRVAPYARGHNAALAATYALQGAAPECSVLRDGFLSFHQFYDRPRSLESSYRLQTDDIREQRKTAFDREIPHEYFPFGALQATDLPKLLAAAKAKIFVIDPIDGEWEQMSAQKARAILPAPVKLVGQVPDLPF